ncbi:hypothetical protein [Hahella sp. HN01]|uniref:hypothetical protein n=1 Tax=Hahella sp. HN01 TaxID=2847262 RepID=UPI001C1EDA16|nr:hypothetical protein [Hahella sp. HN01]MBU6951276.1 hypothetical protein [Hahella sp. HN01]
MKSKILFSVVIIFVAAIASFFILAIRDPVFLAGGSDALDVVVTPKPITQWISVSLFCMAFFYLVFSKPALSIWGKFVKVGLGATSLMLLVSSGHTYTISGKAHALIDQWYGVSVQSLGFNPTEGVQGIRYENGGLFVYLLKEGEVKQTILTGPIWWGLNEETVLSALEHSGVRSYE